MIPTPPIMLKATYSSLSLLFGPIKWAQITYNIFVSCKKTKRKNSWCVGLCSAPLVRSMWFLVGLWNVRWDDCSPCALSFASLVIFVATWVVSTTNLALFLVITPPSSSLFLNTHLVPMRFMQSVLGTRDHT